MTLAVENLPRYERYKDSGFEPIGNIPAHWELLANRHIFRLKKSQVGKKSDQYDLLSLTLKGVIKRDMENPEGKFPAEFDTYQPIETGDFIFCLFDVEETPRTVGISPLNGMITGAYTTFKASPDINHEYLHYLYYFLDKHKMLKPLYRGLRNTIPKENFYAFKTCLPSRGEQDRIVTFLDEKTTQIDQAIKIKEQQITLLKERKQIMIQNAVTKGLDPNVPMKDSGVDWIGEIPAHWEVIKLGSLLKPISIKNRLDLQLLSITREKGVIIRDVDDQESNHNFIPDDLSGYKVIKEGQFGMNKMKAWQGSYGVSEYDGIVSPAYYIFDFTKDIFPPFFHTAIRSSTYVTFFASASDGVRIGQWDLSKTRMKNIPFVIAPPNEQKQIVDYINSEHKKIEKGISIQQTQINNLNEYKASLINSAVTGKIKVI